MFKSCSWAEMIDTGSLQTLVCVYLFALRKGDHCDFCGLGPCASIPSTGRTKTMNIDPK